MVKSASPRRLLLIADSPPFRTTLARLLRVAGHTVWDAETGAAGLAVLRQHPLDLVLTDRDLPGLTGEDVALLVKATHPRLPVVLLMGGTGIAARDRGIRAPVDAILWKPFPFAELVAVLGSLTRGDTLAPVGTVESPATGQRAPMLPSIVPKPGAPGGLVALTGQLRRRMRRSLVPSGR